jgi:beta-N-acetylhexosaminidase
VHGGWLLTKPVILGIAGLTISGDERELLRRHQPQGIILFGRNIQDKTQLAVLTADLRTVLPGDSVLMVDQEGGRVARLRGPVWPDLPAAGSLKSINEARDHGLALGTMVKQAGFDVATAPVLDLRYPGASGVIGDRAISGDPDFVAKCGYEMMMGMTSAGVIPVMKHIPGHGRAKVDSHFELPRVSETDLAVDFYPFVYCSAGLPYGISKAWAMTAHIVYEAFDAQFPATLSKQVISRVIRGIIGFTGTLISDDLAMEALTGAPADRAVAALAAGCDIALYCPGDMAGNRAILEAVAHAA